MNQLDLSADAFTQDAAKSVSASGVAGAGCAGDTGVQQLTLHVSTDNRSDEQLTILLRKPYAPSVAP
jgi:hypothetical protein